VKRAIIHIGDEHVGSTSIQEFLLKNKSLLKEKGIFVPDLIQSSHEELTLLSRDPEFWDYIAADNFSLYGILSFNAVEIERIRESIHRDLSKWIENREEGLFVFSCESLARNLTKDEIDTFFRIVNSWFGENVCIVAYIRDPIAWSLSHWSWAFKAGAITQDYVSLPEPNQNFEPYLTDTMFSRRRLGNIQDHENHWLDSWQQIFGSHLSVYRVGNSNGEISEVVEHFASVLGFESNETAFDSHRANQRLSLKGTLLLNEVNRVIPAYLDDGSKNLKRRNLGTIIDKHTSIGKRYFPNLEIVEAYIAHHRSQEEWLAQKFFSGESAVWDYGKHLEQATEARTFLINGKSNSVPEANLVIDLFKLSDPLEEIRLDSAVAERDSAVAERDSAVAERDSALAERDSAVAERDSAVASMKNLWSELNDVLHSRIWKSFAWYRSLRSWSSKLWQ
jgi:hypothetical protein